MQIEHPKLVLTRIPYSWGWMRSDILVRLLPFAAAYAVAYRLTSGALWLGFSTGHLGVQLLFATLASPAMFVAAAGVQLWLTRRRGVLLVPAGPSDAWFQLAFYALNGPLEEAFFRGLMQGGLALLWGTPAGFTVATLIYVVYHRLGRWTWADTVATGLVGVPMGLAFWLLPGPPSLLGVSIAHIAATAGFLGPGPYLMKKLGLL
jgi:membrane protease YdiL (CAAX protease family)